MRHPRISARAQWQKFWGYSEMLVVLVAFVTSYAQAIGRVFRVSSLAAVFLVSFLFLGAVALLN